MVEYSGLLAIAVLIISDRAALTISRRRRAKINSWIADIIDHVVRETQSGIAFRFASLDLTALGRELLNHQDADLVELGSLLKTYRAYVSSETRVQLAEDGFQGALSSELA